MTAVHGRHEAAGFFQLASAGRNIPFPSQLEGLHKVLVNLMYSKISIIYIIYIKNINYNLMYSKISIIISTYIYYI